MTSSEQTTEERVASLQVVQRYLDERLREVTEAIERGKPKWPSKKLPPWYPEALDEAATLREKIAAAESEIQAVLATEA